MQLSDMVNDTQNFMQRQHIACVSTVQDMVLVWEAFPMEFSYPPLCAVSTCTQGGSLNPRGADRRGADSDTAHRTAEAAPYRRLSCWRAPCYVLRSKHDQEAIRIETCTQINGAAGQRSPSRLCLASATRAATPAKALNPTTPPSCKESLREITLRPANLTYPPSGASSSSPTSSRRARMLMRIDSARLRPVRPPRPAATADRIGSRLIVVAASSSGLLPSASARRHLCLSSRRRLRSTATLAAISPRCKAGRMRSQHAA